MINFICFSIFLLDVRSSSRGKNIQQHIERRKGKKKKKRNNWWRYERTDIVQKHQRCRYRWIYIEHTSTTTTDGRGKEEKEMWCLKEERMNGKEEDEERKREREFISSFLDTLPHNRNCHIPFEIQSMHSIDPGRERRRRRIENVFFTVPCQAKRS